MPVLVERRVAVTLYYLADEGRMRKVANALKLVRCVTMARLGCLVHSILNISLDNRNSSMATHLQK